MLHLLRKRRPACPSQISGHAIPSSPATVDATGEMARVPGRMVGVQRNFSGRPMPRRNSPGRKVHPAVLSGVSIASGPATIDASGEMRLRPMRNGGRKAKKGGRSLPKR